MTDETKASYIRAFRELNKRVNDEGEKLMAKIERLNEKIKQLRADRERRIQDEIDCGLHED